MAISMAYCAYTCLSIKEKEKRFMITPLVNSSITRITLSFLLLLTLQLRGTPLILTFLNQLESS